MTRRQSLMVMCVVVITSVVATLDASGQSASPSAQAAQRYAMLVAEDARPVTRAEAAPLLRGLASPSVTLVRQAVRGIGRLERAEFLPELRRALTDADPGVRAEAANAIAQSAQADPDGALSALRTRFEVERDPGARGALSDAMGRLPFVTPDARIPVERLLTRALADEFSPLAVRLGAVRGIESLIRKARGTTFAAGPDTVAALRTAALGVSRPIGTGDEDRVRRTAVQALNNAAASDATYDRLIMDHDVQVRRLAVVAAIGPMVPDLRERIVKAGLADVAFSVRYDALRAHARHLASEQCQPELDAVADPNPHVSLLAIDLLATTCPGRAEVNDVLGGLAGSPQSDPVTPAVAAAPGQATTPEPDPAAARGGGGVDGWHRQAHALVALARRAPEAAKPLVGPAAAHAVWQVRMYAARAAANVGDADTLVRLAADAQAPVRAAAIDGLRQVKKHDADTLYREAFARPDYPVVMAAAKALEGTPDKAPAIVVLGQALATLTAQARDTSRDARLAILDRLAELGGLPQAETLAPYVADSDPRVATRVAEMLTFWTGNAQEVKTTRQKMLALPPQDEMDTLPARVRVTMANGRSFVMRFFTDETPVAVWRVARLVRQAYYDGLTWHRIIPNFIIQGGSPGADEFVGDGPFMRDEFGMRSHTRGTVGISTRGRDTGDAQLFINLMDSPRLDHDYTVIGEVVEGLDVVDAILEGDVMASVTLEKPPAAKSLPE